MPNIIGNGSILTSTTESNSLLPAIVRNNSPTTTRTNVRVVFTLSPGLKWPASQVNTPTQGTFDPSTSTWTVGTVLPSTSESFDFQVEVVDATLRPFVVEYEVFYDLKPDQVPENDVSSRTFTSDLSCEDFALCGFLTEDHGPVVYVATTGDNLTAKRGEEHFPFRDPWTAAANSQDGDLIVVYPGEYTIGTTGSGADFEYTPGSPETFSLTNTGFTTQRFYFHPGVIIRSTIDGTSESTPPTLFDDFGSPMEIQVEGELIFRADEKGVRVGNADNAASLFDVHLKSIFLGNQASNSTDANPPVFGNQQGVYVNITVESITGAFNRIMYLIQTTDDHLANIHIDFIRSEELLVDGIGKAAFQVGLAGGVSKGNTVIEVDTYELVVDNSISVQDKGQGILVRLVGDSAVDYQFYMHVKNYNDNVVIQTSNPAGDSVVSISNIPTNMTNSQYTFRFENVITGSNFVDYISSRVSMIGSTVNFEAGRIKLTSDNVFARIGAPHRIATFTDSAVIVNPGKVIRAVAADLPMISFTGNNFGTRTRSHCIISGVFQQNGNAPVLSFTTSGSKLAYLLKDCTFLVNDAVAPIISTGSNTRVRIQNVISNSMIDDANTIETGQPIVRDALYV